MDCVYVKASPLSVNLKRLEIYTIELFLLYLHNKTIKVIQRSDVCII